MKLYWCKNTRAFRIAWLLEETGLKYERVIVDIRDEHSKNDPAFRAVSSMGKVPALGWGSFDLMLGVLRTELAKGDWILGERFSAADVLIGTSAFYLKQFGLIEDDPLLGAYVARCTARPAWKRAQAFDAG